MSLGNKYSFISSFSNGFPGGSYGKESAYNARDLGSIHGSGRSLGEGNGTHSSILAWRDRERERENVFPFLNLCFLFVWFLFFAMLHGKWDLSPSTRDLTRAPCIGRYLILCRNGNNRNLGVILNSKGKSFNIFTTN